MINSSIRNDSSHPPDDPRSQVPSLSLSLSLSRTSSLSLSGSYPQAAARPWPEKLLCRQHPTQSPRHAAAAAAGSWRVGGDGGWIPACRLQPSHLRPPPPWCTTCSLVNPQTLTLAYCMAVFTLTLAPLALQGRDPSESPHSLPFLVPLTDRWSRPGLILRRRHHHYKAGLAPLSCVTIGVRL